MQQPTGQQQTPSSPNWRNCLWLAGIFALVYGMLLSTHWVEGTPDSEYYLAIARNLSAGMGFVWDGRPVLMVPPGWPLFLAGAIRICSWMLFLNLVPFVLAIVGLVLWYLVLEKITSPRRAFVVTLVFGILFNYHRFAQHFYSESLFVPLLAATLLLALRIRRGPVRIWHGAAIFALCGSLVLVRWAGVLFCPLIVAFCFSWRPWREQKGPLIVAAVCCVALAATFLATRKGMSIYARDKLATEGETQAVVETVGPDNGEMQAADETPDLQWHSNRTYTALSRARHNWLKRLIGCGLWPTESIGRLPRSPSRSSLWQGWSTASAGLSGC